MKARKDVREAYIKLGDGWNLSDELLDALEKVTCSLCTPSTATASNITDVRYNLFCAKNLTWWPLARIASVSKPWGQIIKHVFGEEVLKGIRSFLVQWVWAGRWKHLLILKFLVLNIRHFPVYVTKKFELLKWKC